MRYPEFVLEIAKACSEKHETDIDAAVVEAEQLMRTNVDFEDVVGKLISDAIRDLIHDFRHQVDKAIRKEVGFYGQPGKVRVGDSTSVNKAYESLFQYRIGGTVLGMLSGADLDRLELQETAIARGHTFNASLCREVRRRVTDTAVVKDVLSEAQLKAIFVKVAKLSPLMPEKGGTDKPSKKRPVPQPV